MNRSVASSNALNESWKNSNATNIAPRARFESLARELTTTPAHSNDGQMVKAPSFGKLLNAFGAGPKKDHMPSSSDRKDLFSFGLESSRGKKTRGYDEDNGPTTEKEAPALNLPGHFKRPFNLTRAEKPLNESSAHNETNIPLTKDEEEQLEKTARSFRSMVQKDEEFSDLLGMLRKNNGNGHHGPIAVSQRQSNQVPSSNFALRSRRTNESDKVTHQANRRQAVEINHQSSAVPLRRSSAPASSIATQPLKSILLAPRYSYHELTCSTLERSSSVVHEMGMNRLNRSGSSVQFSSPTVHLIDRDRQNSGWYTQEDEERMRRKYIRSKVKKMMKKKMERENSTEELR